MAEIEVIYEASSGNRYNLKTDPLLIGVGNFHNYAWDKEVTALRYGERVESWKKNAQTYSTTFWLVGTESQNRLVLRNLHNDFERDILNKKPGKIIWNQDYIECYIIESSTYPHENRQWTVNEVSIYCPSPFWVSEQVISLQPVVDDGQSEEQEFLDYPFDYPFEYTWTTSSIVPVEIDHYSDSAFKLVIFGPVSNPSIDIGENRYNVNVSVAAGEYLTIDSRDTADRDRQVYLTKNDGTIQNVFDLRNPGYQILKRIPSGTVDIVYSRAYGIDLHVYKERSEPGWMI